MKINNNDLLSQAELGLNITTLECTYDTMMS